MYVLVTLDALQTTPKLSGINCYQAKMHCLIGIEYGISFLEKNFY